MVTPAAAKGRIWAWSKELTMTSINDIADLVQILQDHPEWRNTVRGLIVGEELANMPNEVAIFVKATNENFNLIHQQFEKVDQQFEKVDQRLEKVDQRLERLETNVAEIKTDVATLKENVSRIDETLTQMGGTVSRLIGEDYESHVAHTSTDSSAGAQA